MGAAEYAYLRAAMKILMKQLITFLSLILILSTCKKVDAPTDQVYSIHIGLSVLLVAPQGATNRLIITETGTGKYLGEFEFSKDVYDYTGQLNVEGFAPTAFDYHLIHPTNDPDHPYLVFSQIGVSAGSFVYFYPFENFRWQGKPISLKINGIQSVDSIGTGFFKPENVVLDENEKVLSLDIQTLSHFGITLRLLANNASGFRFYYLPEAIQGDTLTINWNDLTPETALKQISLPGDPYIYTVEIDAISPDYKNAISVVRCNGSATIPGYNLPAFIPTNWLLRVKVYSSDFFCERLFGIQESIALSSPNISIDNLDFSNNQIIVNTSGDVDNIHCSSFDGDFYWEINGSKEAFIKVALPDLSPFLPASVRQNSITGFVAAVQKFEGYDYTEIQEGFPYLNSGLFPVARSGFYQIQQSF